MIVIFLVNILSDDTILPDITENIFIEIIEGFPSKFDKKTIGQMLLKTSEAVIDKRKSEFIIDSISNITKKKFVILEKILEIFPTGFSGVTPN